VASASSRSDRSADLRRELGVVDLLCVQIVMIVGGTWVGTAGKLGPGHAVYWLLASAFFFVPLVAVVLYLNRWAPLEGGLYQWAKLGLSPGVGFMVAFNLWLWAVVLLAGLGLDLVTSLGYAFHRLAWMHEDRAVPAIASVTLIASLAGAALLGLRVGKRVTDAGGMVRMAVYGLLLLLPLIALVTGHPLRSEVASPAPPPSSLQNVNLLAKMGFGAFSGFEYAAIFAGESRSPMRSFARSVYLAAPIVVLMFVLGTSSVLAFVAPDDIDLIAPIPQVLRVATGGTGLASGLASAVMVLLLLGEIAWGSSAFAGITRLPMVAGWDGLLPAWFTRLSPRSRVPVNSILFLAVVTVTLAVAGLSGVGHQEAYQLFSSSALVFYALTYLAMFAIPLAGLGKDMPPRPATLRVACASGFLTTLLFVVLAIFPIVRVESRAAFGLKVISVVLAANSLGAAVYFAGKKRLARETR
jgi:amino acid transporter